MKTVKIIAAVMSAAVIAASTAGTLPIAENSVIVAEAASKLPAPKGVTKSASENSVTLKWKKVRGADAYRVYIYDPAKKKYITYKDVTSRRCTVKGLDGGVSYKFRIAALVKSGGKYSVQKKTAAITVSTKAAEKAEESAASSVTELTVTSEDLSDGVWSTVITNTSRGSNRSPELSWNAVDGAEEYAVYMLDISANNWMHWRVSGVKSTHLDAGSASSTGVGGALKNEYIGPYPPSGTHTYVVTVFALKSAADSYPGNFDSTNSGIDRIRQALDISGGAAGNIIAEASVSGTYTHGT